MRAFLFVVALIALGVTVVPAAQTDLTGSWTLSFNTPNGQIDAAATFKVDGDKLTGTLTSPAGEVAITGTVKGNTFTGSFDVQSPNGNMSITINGEQDGDALKGTFDFGQGMGDWTGKRNKT